MNKSKFLFRGRRISCNWRWSDEDTFICKFGEGELKDIDNDDCWLLCEYHASEDKYIIQSCYEEAEAFLVYSDYKDANVFPIIFSLSNEEVNNIKKFMKSKGARKE